MLSSVFMEHFSFRLGMGEGVAEFWNTLYMNIKRVTVQTSGQQDLGLQSIRQNKILIEIMQMMSQFPGPVFRE